MHGRKVAPGRERFETSKQLRPYAARAVEVRDDEQIDREYGPVVEAVCRAPERETGAIAPLVPGRKPAGPCPSGPSGVAPGKCRPRGKGDMRRDNPHEREGRADVALQKRPDSGMEGTHALPGGQDLIRVRAAAQGISATA